MKFSAVHNIVRVFFHITRIAAVLALRALRACARLAGTMVVLALVACPVLLLMPDLWCLVLHADRLAAAAQAWRDSGPHKSLLGRIRAGLAATGLLTAPRDPLAECGVPGGEGWRHHLQLMLLPDGRHACLERQVQLAWEEHQAFTATLLLAAACLSLLALCLLGWAWRRHHHPVGTEDDAPPGEGRGAEEGEDAAPPNAVQEEVEDTAPQDAVQEEEEEDAAPPDAVQKEGEDSAPSQTPADPGRGEEQQAGRRAAGRQVRHSLHVPPYLRERLVGPLECFLAYLRRRHSVLIFMDAARRRMHVKGAEEDVVLCCAAVKVLLAQWGRRHAAAPE